MDEMTVKFKERIGVLMGGSSSERDISLQSGQAIYRALKSEGWMVEAIDIISERTAAGQVKKAGIEMA